MFEEDLSSEGAQGMAFIIHEALFPMKFSQTKLQIKSKKISNDLYYTTIKNLSDEEREK